jgi:hypothetical protein
MSIDLNTGIVFANTQARRGALVLPNTRSIPGRVLIFKDSIGTFQQSSLALAVQPGQTIDQGLVSSVQVSRFGWTTLTGGPSNSWFVTGGTNLNSIATTSTVVDFISTASFLQSNIFLSNLFLRDQILPRSNVLYTSSSLLFYSTVITNTIVAGGYKQSFGSLVLRVRP